MDNESYSRKPRKRNSRKFAQRSRITALILIILLIIIGFILIITACSDDKEDSGDTMPQTSQTTTTALTTTAPVTTTTEMVITTQPAATADPDDPNTITQITLDKYAVNVEVGEEDMPWVTMYPETAPKSYKEEIWESSDPYIATVDDKGNIIGVSAGQCIVTVTSKNNPQIFAEVKVVVSDSALGSQADIIVDGEEDVAEEGIVVKNGLTYVDGILIANKTYSLPADYAPGLNSTVKAQFDKLSAAAAKEGLNIYLSSGYRSYSYQNQIYNNYCSIYGAEKADTFSARPGHSEHQTGLAIDVNSIDDSFAGTPEAIWLADHAHEYGFIIRYPKDKVAITGYKYEPWHIRYLGVKTAVKVYNSGLCLEEYLNINSVYGS